MTDEQLDSPHDDEPAEVTEGVKTALNPLVAITRLVENTDLMLRRQQTLAALIANGDFKYVSKTRRNIMLKQIIDDVEEFEALTKIAFRALKKVKRERIPEDKADMLLGAVTLWQITQEVLNGEAPVEGEADLNEGLWHDDQAE